MRENMQETAHALFQYIREVGRLRQSSVLNVERHVEGVNAVRLRELCDVPCVQMFSRDREEASEEGEELLSFHKPEFTPCPPPGASLEPWLKPGWQDFHKPLGHLSRLSLPQKETVPEEEEPEGQLTNDRLLIESAQMAAERPTVSFSDNPERVARYGEWAALREEWAKGEKETERLRERFDDLFDMYNLYRESPDAYEIMVGNGLLTDKKHAEIRHPILLKRVSLSLDSVRNTLNVLDTDAPPQIYLAMINEMEDVHTEVLRPLEKRAEEENIHPLDHESGGDLYKSIVHSLCSSGRYQGDGEPECDGGERLVLRWEPYVFLRKRADGTDKAMEAILEDIKGGAEIPGSLRGILGDFEERMLENQLRDGTGEALDSLQEEEERILLPKPANDEQLEIVRRIERSQAVVVQGPPGTGKTYTITNLLGHFLAEGKTVLVSSHTSKALSVLKEKIPKKIQALCVSMLDDDRRDMENSIREINDHTDGCNASACKRQVEALQIRRHSTYQAWQAARELVYRIRRREFEPIVYQGESWSPSEAAKLVAQHEELLRWIPGELKKDAAFPLTPEELEQLWQSSESLSAAEEAELRTQLPEETELLTPAQFAGSLKRRQELEEQLRALNVDGQLALAWQMERGAVVNRADDEIYAQRGDGEAAKSLLSMMESYREVPERAAFALSDGASEGLPRKRWEELLNRIETTYEKAQLVLEGQLSMPIKLLASDHATLEPVYRELLEEARQRGRVKKGLFMKKEKRSALEAVSIDGKQPENLEEIKRVNDWLELLSLREKLETLWDRLMAAHGEKRFSELGEEPERKCYQHRREIEAWINWAGRTRGELRRLAEAAGVGACLCRQIDAPGEMTDERAAALLAFLRERLLSIAKLLPAVHEMCAYVQRRADVLNQLKACASSVLCQQLRTAIELEQAEQYERVCGWLNDLRRKGRILDQREQLLRRVEAAAPTWAEAIRQRSESAGGPLSPEEAMKAWRVKQLSAQVDELNRTSLSDATEQAENLGAQYRQETEELAAAQAWCCLQERIEQNLQMQQALRGWAQTVKKIGKGTGKRAAGLRAEARRLMADCQKAVPAWIMPVSSVMNTINPAKTKFDVLILDEASQSGIAAAALLYMGRKIIIVGDDKQVSPAGVGENEQQMEKLRGMFIKNKVYNAHLWDARTSIYDVAQQVYSPLMLKEHFRCVPDIIGYSNALCYDGKIKPLREAGSSPFKTAIVPFRVCGQRNKRKVNAQEAEAIVALIKACLERAEYADKSIGVISLLGKEQAAYISRRLLNEIPLTQHEEHRILCGDASSFQGDERDVIFLSMVDSNDKDGPLFMADGEGQGSNGTPMKQRYNVAVNRAKDQLWVVHSLDVQADLKQGDLRRGLLEYADCPSPLEIQKQHIQEKAESLFEEEVAAALVERGYHIEQQWPVGAYRIDIVAICEGRKVAIECDGERYHSGEEKVWEDMERQRLLERLGWRFIRIRGSEYYRSREQTIERVVKDLMRLDIQPEREDLPSEEDTLLTWVKTRSAQLMEQTMHKALSPEVHGETVRSEAEGAQPTAAPEKSAAQSEGFAVAPAQQSAQAVDDLIAAFAQVGLECVDHRAESNILWVVYDEGKTREYLEIADRFSLGKDVKLERRGAKATQNRPAWRVMIKK